MKNLKSFSSKFWQAKSDKKNVHAWCNEVCIKSLKNDYKFLEWLEKCMLSSTQNFMSSDGQ